MRYAILILSLLISIPAHAGAFGDAVLINGICSAVSTNQPLQSAPTSGLCYLGTPSAVSGSGPYTWTCAGAGGGTTASCQTLTYEGGNGTYFVSPTGSDSNNGTSSSTPFQTLGKCQTAMRGGATKICYMMTGTFTLGADLTFSWSDNKEQWLACPASACGSLQAPIIDGASLYGWYVDSVTGLYIGGIQFQNNKGTSGGSTGSAIYCHYSTNVAIVGNTINSVLPTSENGGSVYGQHCTNSVIDSNYFNGSTWSAVSLSGTNTASANSNTVVSRNVAAGTVSTCTDCGIYYNYEGTGGYGSPNGGSSSVGWIYNVANMSGTPSGQRQRCYYDDDNTSYRAYYGNLCYGGSGASGVGGVNAPNALLLHGSAWVTIHNNIFDCTSFYYCVWLQNSSTPNFIMQLNYITSNIFYSGGASGNLFYISLVTANAAFPYSGDNLYYAVTPPHTYTLTITDPQSPARPWAQSLLDTSPQNGVNPNFTNPSGGNYAFTDGGIAARPINFTPLPQCSVNGNGIGVTCQ